MSRTATTTCSLCKGRDSVDIVITPGVNQELLSFPLVCPTFYSM